MNLIISKHLAQQKFIQTCIKKWLDRSTNQWPLVLSFDLACCSEVEIRSKYQKANHVNFKRKEKTEGGVELVQAERAETTVG